VSEHEVNISDQDNISPADISPSRNQPNHRETEDRIAAFSSNILDRGDSIIYAIVGICFFVGALFALGFSFWDFASEMQAVSKASDVGLGIIKLVSDLLLVLIIMEVLSTVIHYLKEHATSLRPFLFIGIVSATRGILSIGARLSVGEVTGSAFNNAMIELGVNAAVILALGITLKMLGQFFEDKP